MRPGQRFGLSAIEKRDVWSRWKAGQSLHEIGRRFDKPHSCIRAVLLPRRSNLIGYVRWGAQSDRFLLPDNHSNSFQVAVRLARHP
jgi:hypothetical protein